LTLELGHAGLPKNFCIGSRFTLGVRNSPSCTGSRFILGVPKSSSCRSRLILGAFGLCSSIFICSCLTLGVLELLGNGATTGIASASSPHSNIEQQGQMEGAGLSLHGYT
jgi:hypothetical protein